MGRGLLLLPGTARAQGGTWRRRPWAQSVRKSLPAASAPQVTSCCAGPGVRAHPSCAECGHSGHTSSPTFYSYKDSRACDISWYPQQDAACCVGPPLPERRPVWAPAGTSTCSQMLPSGHVGSHCPRAPESPAGTHLQGRRPRAQPPGPARAGLLWGGSARGTVLPGGARAGGPDQRERRGKAALSGLVGPWCWLGLLSLATVAQHPMDPRGSPCLSPSLAGPSPSAGPTAARAQEGRRERGSRAWGRAWTARGSRGAPRSRKPQPFQALGGGAEKQLWVNRWKASVNVCTFGKALNCQSPPGPLQLAGPGGTQVALWLAGPGLLAGLKFHWPPPSCGPVSPPAPPVSPQVGGPGSGGDDRQMRGWQHVRTATGPVQAPGPSLKGVPTSVEGPACPPGKPRIGTPSLTRRSAKSSTQR